MSQRRAVRRRRSIRAAAIASVLTVVCTPAVAPPASAQALTARSVTVSIIDLSPSTPPATTATTPLTVILNLTNVTDQTLTGVRVEASRGNPISNRAALDSAIANVQPPDPSLAAPITTQHPVTTSLGPRATVKVSFTTLTSTLDGSGLCICENRIYPLYVTIHAKDTNGSDIVVGDAQTFVPAFGKSKPQPVQVSWVWPIVDRPHRRIGDTVFLDDELSDSVSQGRLNRVLQVVENVATKALPMTLLIDPELLDELAVMATGDYTVTVGGRSTPGTGGAHAKSWLARLRGALIADPQLELDLTPLADPDVESLTRSGLSWTVGLGQVTESRISTALGGHLTANDLAWPANEALSSDTLEALVRQGATSVIVSDTTLPTAGSDASLVNQLGTVQTPAGPITADITQRTIQRYVDSSMSVGAVGASTTLPQLVAEVAIAAVVDGTTSHFVTIVAPRYVDPLPELAWRAIADTEFTSWSSATTLEQAAHTVQPSIRGQLTAPGASSGQLSPAITGAAANITQQIPALSSMLNSVDASALLGSLPTAVQRAESTWWRSHPADGNAFAAKLSQHVGAIEAGVRIVRPSAGTYTLAASNSPLPVTVENNLEVSVTVRVQVSSYNGVPGFRTETLGNQTIAAKTKVTLHVPTQVERTGRFRVQVVLLTPSNDQLGQAVFVSVHSTALGAVGVIITVVAAVVLVLALLIRFARRLRARPAGPTIDDPVTLL